MPEYIKREDCGNDRYHVGFITGLELAQKYINNANRQKTKRKYFPMGMLEQIKVIAEHYGFTLSG